MSSRNELIQTLRKTLKRAKTDLIDDDELYDDKLFCEILDSLSIICDEQIFELVPEILELLESWNASIREEAILTLSFDTRLQIPEFKDIAYKIWLSDPNENVRGTALRAWAAFFTGKKDPKVLKILYNVLKNENYSVNTRRDAMVSIFDVTRIRSKFYNPYKSKSFHFLSSHEELNNKIDWKEIEDIIRKYAPDALDSDITKG